MKRKIETLLFVCVLLLLSLTVSAELKTNIYAFAVEISADTFSGTQISKTSFSEISSFSIPIFFSFLDLNKDWKITSAEIGQLSDYLGCLSSGIYAYKPESGIQTSARIFSTSIDKQEFSSNKLLTNANQNMVLKQFPTSLHEISFKKSNELNSLSSSINSFFPKEKFSMIAHWTFFFSESNGQVEISFFSMKVLPYFLLSQWNPPKFSFGSALEIGTKSAFEPPKSVRPSK
ncbi:MAG: hypothetical protein HQM10_12610 [Candidatus Riflebacteria bacterium]|nr:hypothetical protein [Candidatus Riflebacteria bacterium]